MEKFEQTYSFKLIYVLSIPYKTHEGLLKIGDTTIKTSKDPSEILPNSHELNSFAKDRIKSYTATAGIPFTLHYTELAIKQNGAYISPFRDMDVHDVLRNSGYHQIKPNGNTGNDWFDAPLDAIKLAITAVKAGKDTISLSELPKTDDNEEQKTIEFRDEQLDAIEKTMAVLKKENEMLWYAKMRFGKTVTALEVVRRFEYRRVIIVTHRPVVSDGWSTDFAKIFYPGASEHDYCFELKTNDSAYTFDEKIDLENDLKIRRLDKNGDYFLYFASIQDLRGSSRVGGKFNKNNAVFDLDWDLIIIDEAHEGTQTALGDNVMKQLRKANTKVLSLSGTPFNLLNKFGEDNVYTWDYVMEQKKKAEWDATHHGDHNPYADLPQMHIYTYDLGEKLKKYVTDEYDTKAFNFREFFRVWSRGPHGKRELPVGAVEGNFVHEADVRAFLDLMAKEDENSIYPFSTDEYRNMFRHTLWMVPGVKEARALSELLRHHPVFMHFGIANVAGEGDTFEEDHAKDALELVRTTIRNNKYSITLSCGKLTTGVTVPEWTAVLMLSGSYSTAAAQYMQTIFRVQSAGSIDGKQKTDCYVFDFAPDRTLKVLTETVHLSRKPGKNQNKRREIMTEFLNYCPVIAIAGSRMTKYSVNSMMEQVKQIYAERAVNSGFEDESIYNDELLKLGEIDASKFNHLKDIIGSSKAQKKKDSVTVNGQGLTDEQIEHIDDDDEPYDLPSPPTPEEIVERQKKKQAKEARRKAIDILRGISIRMPLMIYGANVPIDEDIDIDRFVELVDDRSWAEFMPKGVTKRLFAHFTKYYDRDVFIAAGKRIRKLAAAADRETPTRRVKMIAEIFRHFKNPDKETVLTPWRVVNMHMSDTLGGWCFFNEQFEDDTQDEKHRLDEPRFVDRGDVTAEVFRKDTHILEINSKTGLYPLYVAYSVYRTRLANTTDDDREPEELQAIWEEVLRDNIYVICKTPMAKYITTRTLTGYHDNVVNAHCFNDLVNMLKSKPEQFKKKILKGSYWGKEVKEMKFDAVVGNPPYQEEISGGTNTKRSVYNYFIDISSELSSKVSLIHPARFLFNAGNTSKEWNAKILDDVHFKVVKYWPNSSEIFPTVEIKGGIAITYRDAARNFGAMGIFTAHPELNAILSKVKPHIEMNGSIAEICFVASKFDIENLGEDYSQYREHERRMSSNVLSFECFHSEPELQSDIAIFGIYQGKRAKRYISEQYVDSSDTNIKKHKVVLPKADGSGSFGETITNPEILGINVGFTHTFLGVGGFDSEQETAYFVKYAKTKFARALLGILKVTQDLNAEKWSYVPLQDFTERSDIDWTRSIPEIDRQLYAKYGLNEDEIRFIEANVKRME